MHRFGSSLAWFAGLILLVTMGSGCSCNLIVAPSTYSDPARGPEGLDKATTNVSDCLEVKPTLQDFGAIPVGCGEGLQNEVEVRHKGSPTCPRPIRVNKIVLESSGTSGFLVEERPALPHTLEPGKSMKVKLSFNTTQLLSSKDKLLVQTNAPDQENLNIELVGKGVRELPKRDTFKQVIQPSDILFVLDNSRSMRQEQTFLAKNFSSFMQWAQRYHSDVQIGITPIRTGDTTLGCLKGSPAIMTPQTPNLAEVFGRIATTLDSARGPEMGLEAAFLALSEPKRSGCNKGFLRDKAVLSLVFISDEPDQSPQEYDFYVNFFKSLKGEERTHMVRASAVVGPSPGGCRSSYGRATPGPNYIRLAKELQGISASICQADWSKPLEQIGLWSILSRFKYPLSRNPINNSLRVTVNGKLVAEDEKNGWQYKSNTNEVEFHGASIPVPGDTIVVDYLVDCPPSTPSP